MMKTSKKITAGIAAAALTMAMATTAFAAEITTSGGSDSAQVNGRYVAGSGSGTVYKVDVAWESMEFTYTAGDEGAWNPETHTYESDGSGSWSSTTNGITVTNHSNAALTGTFAFTGASGFENLQASFSNTSDGTFTLADASQGESLGNPSNAPSVSSDMTLSGDIGSFENGTIGTVTVTINNQ